MSFFNPIQPQIIRAGGGQRHTLAGETRCHLLDSDDTHGSFCLSASHALPGTLCSFSTSNNECLLIGGGSFQLQTRPEEQTFDLQTDEVVLLPPGIGVSLFCMGHKSGTFFRVTLLRNKGLPEHECGPARIIGAKDGECLEAFGERARVVLPSAELQNRLCLLEIETPPLSGWPLHQDETQNRAYFIRAGRYEFCLDDARVQVTAGDTIFVPRCVPQSFRVLSAQPGRLFLLSPSGGLDLFLHRASRLFEQRVQETGMAPNANLSAVGDGNGMHFLSSTL